MDLNPLTCAMKTYIIRNLRQGSSPYYHLFGENAGRFSID